MISEAEQSYKVTQVTKIQHGAHAHRQKQRAQRTEKRTVCVTEQRFALHAYCKVPLHPL